MSRSFKKQLLRIYLLYLHKIKIMNIKNKTLNNVCVYQHRRADTNEIFYVGIGNIKRAYIKTNRNKYWKNIINKTDYKIEILHENLSWELACEIEIHLIKFYGRKDLRFGNLVNMTNGGEGAFGYILSQKRLQQIKLQNLGKIRSQETKNKISSHQLLSGNKRGEKNGMFGKKGELCPNYGKTMSEETKSKLRAKAKLRVISEETKLKMSINGKGKTNKLILSLETGIFYNGVKDASIIYNIKYSTLAAYLNGNTNNKTDLIYV